MILAQVLNAGHSAVASHRAAAWLWRVGPSREPVVELTVNNHQQRRIDALVHRRLPTPLDSPHDRLVREGIVVTSPLLTVVQLGAVVPQWAVASTLDDMVGRKLVTIRGVQAALARLGGRGRRGAGVLRRVLVARGLGDLAHDGALEPMFADLCERFALPRPVFQHPIVLGRRRRRIDFAYPERKIAIEVDGYEAHTRFEVFEDDRIRANELELLGWTMLQFTWHQLVHRPDLVARTISTALHHALPAA
jgi:hypothetical protein